MSENAPQFIPYMPAGAHVIHATVNGEPGCARVYVDASACARLNADLAELWEAARRREHARPVLYFDHKQGEAAAFPRRFVWDDERGILLEIAEWTAAGRAAVEGSNYGYISPAFRLSREDGQVLGLVPGVEVGSLVNDPAFERIDPIVDNIAASKAAPLTPGVDIVTSAHCSQHKHAPDCSHGNGAFPPPQKISTADSLACAGKCSDNGSAAKTGGNTTMTEEIKKKLGLPEDADDAAVEAAVTKLVTERDAHKKKAEDAEAEAKKKDEELKAARASEKQAWLDDLKQRGVLAPKDEAAVEAAAALFEANPAAARTAYGKMQGVATGAVITASQAGQPEEKSIEDLIQF